MRQERSRDGVGRTAGEAEVRRLGGLISAAAVLVALTGTAQGRQSDEVPGADDQPILVTPAGEVGDEQAGEQGVNEVPAQPTGELPAPQPGAETITLSSFSEPVELTALVEYVAETLGIDIAVTGGLQGTVTLSSSKTIRRDQLLDLLDALLEQQNFTITRDRMGFYTVRPVGEVPVNVGGDAPTTRIISTPNAKPSSLRIPIESQLGGGGGQVGAQSQNRIAYVDDLGIIVITDTPRRVQAVSELIAEILAEQARMGFIRFELKHIAAPVARQRAIELVGQGQSGGGFNQFVDPNQAANQAFPGARGPSINNLADRLVVDQQSNALIFRGLESEAAAVDAVLAAVDQPSTLEPRPYETGSATKDIANFAKMRGLGDLVELSSDAALTPEQLFNQAAQGQFGQGGFQTQRQSTGGPVLVVDESRGKIVYYGTPEQHELLAALVAQFEVKDEVVVIREYKLHNADAAEIADLLLGLLQNEVPAGEGGLLPESRGSNVRSRVNRRNERNRGVLPGSEGRTTTTPEGEEGTALEGGDDVFVLADEANNQVLVKAPVRQQADFARLIMKLDLRRPQVYIDAQIVSVTANESFRLAFETQLINANGTGGVVNTNFGLTSPPEGGGDIRDPKVVGLGLSGLTAALIKSDQVPIVINALKNEANARILSSPSLLVDDNEEAEIVSVEIQYTQTVTQTAGNPLVTTVGDEVEAGTTLRVTPSISEGDYIRLQYEVELSNFIGEGTATLPPPKQERSINAESVTIPGDTTIVVGGITVSNKGRTVAKVPLLGDIPIIGALFSDTRENDSETTLYVFLTPKILRDTNFNDLRLLTRGPQAKMELEPDLPELEPAVIEIIGLPPPRPPREPAPRPTAPGEVRRRGSEE